MQIKSASNVEQAVSKLSFRSNFGKNLPHYRNKISKNMFFFAKMLTKKSKIYAKTCEKIYF